MTKLSTLGPIAVADPFAVLDKRERIALRHALEGGTAPAPGPVVRRLTKLGLARPTGHTYAKQEWGKVVLRWPIFQLTPDGEKCAKAIVAILIKGGA